MPECHLCGYEYKEGARYCAQCGVGVDGREMASELTLPEWESTEELLELSKVLSSTLDLDLLLRKIDDSAVKLTSGSAGSIMLFDEEKRALRFRSSSGEKATVVRAVPVMDGIAWWVAQNGEVARVDNVTEDSRFTGTIDKISGFKTKSSLCVPVMLEDEIIGIIEVLNKKNKVSFTDDDERLLCVLASQAAVAVKNARMATEQRNFFTHVIEILVTAIESTRFVPEGHCWKVAKLATAMGRRLGMKDQELQDLYYAAALHDLGVLSLVKSGSREEDQMRAHPEMGASMVQAISMLQNTESIIHHHHEYFDGSGYPDGLRGDEIPTGAKIIAVLEVYEETISEGEDQISAMAVIQANSGELFDPVVVETFLELMAVDGD